MEGSSDISALTLGKIQEKICEVCAHVSQSQTEWTFTWADDTALQRGAARVGGPTSVDTALLMGIVRRERIGEITNLCTFYLGYSTWQGRVLFLENMELQEVDKDTVLWTRLLAQVGSALHCGRLVWAHRGALPSYGSNQVETLNGWLTLHWKIQDMQSSAIFQCGSTPDTSLPLQLAFSNALRESQKHESFRLRLATEKDLLTIDRLIRGLAEFEKEPEAYKLSLDQLRKDGFSDRPFYYCILVDDVATVDNGQEPHTCAMAFCYVGYHLSQGRFLYLEDLFFEEEYRGQGGGKLVMSTLASVAQSLGCTKAVWQALDWNTPALKFYEKLGACVQEGLITSRFTGENIKAVAELPLVDSKR